MSSFQQLYARLAQDTTTQKSLFTALFAESTRLKLMLDNSAVGTANFAIYQNGNLVQEKRVTAGESIEFTGADLIFYVNYYDATDLPTVNVSATSVSTTE